MKILKIWAENVRSISSEVSIEFAPDGLTLVSAPNEFGKSTLAQIPKILIERPYGSKREDLKNLQPVGDSGAPVKMGMKFSINDQIFEIRKTFIKDIGAVLTPIEPIGKEFKDDPAEQKLDSLLGPLDKVFFNLLNMAQGQSSTILATSQKDLQGNRSLQTFVEQSSSLDTDSNAAQILEDVAKEYLGWWTPTGKPSSIAGSNGRLLVDARQKASTLETEISRLRDDLAKREEAIKSQEAEISDSGDLTEIFSIQQKAAELASLLSQIDKYETLDRSRKLYRHLDVKLQKWSEAKHEDLKSTHDSFLRIQAMSKLKLTALKDLDLLVNDLGSSIKAGKTVEINQVPGTSVQIGDLATLEFESEELVDTKKLISESNRHRELLIECDLKDISESNEIYNYQKILESIEIFEKENGTGEALNEAVKPLESARKENPDFWVLAANQPKVRVEDIRLDSGAAGRIEGLKEGLEKENFPGRIEQLEWDLQESQKVLNKRTLEAGAAKLLYETLLSHRDKTRSRISSGLESVLQKHIDGIFTSEARISLNEDLSFDVLKRDGKSISTEWLSRGASEQLALAFRLAIAEVAKSECELPIILDDDFAHSDKTRLSRIAKHLQTIGKQQIILFTHQPEKFELFSGLKIELG